MNAFGKRELQLFLLCVLLAIPAFFLGRGLLLAITLCNNLFFYGEVSVIPASQAGGVRAWGLLVPALGGLIVGLIARYGSSAVRGHGIPEVMEAVLSQESRVPLKVALLKPLCSAISIGSGGPFGAEGPVIGLGGSLGSLLGQVMPVSPWERKVLLAAGAAAGVTAVFGCPVAALLLSVELLLFEYTPTSFVAVGLASAVAGGLRVGLLGGAPIFPMPALAESGATSLACYAALGLPLGLAATGIILLVRSSEHLYEKLPLHWMWWPALGGLGVGALGWVEPRVFGPSYESIGGALSGQLVSTALLSFVAFKLAAWALALGSGTAGGTLAPLFGIGSGLGALLTGAAAWLWPSLGLDPRMGALVGMAAVFAGASHALLGSLVLALETTHQFSGTLPLLAACLVSTLVCQSLLPHSLMTDGPTRRGVKFPHAK